jgi:hypothetical protein
LSPITARVDGLWAKVLDGPGAGGTLDPLREHATPLAALVEHATASHPELRDALAEGITEIVEAQLRSFPENLFWDLDLLGARLVAQSSSASEPAERLLDLADRIARLQDLYGQRTPIRFRYVHDFLYGFDWARWVTRRPADRAGVGPFDQAFLAYGFERGHELLALIEAGDVKYPPLDAGDARNPFRFSREPDDERRLLRDLAARELVPVEAWRPDGRARWREPFSDLREERARALGL